MEQLLELLQSMRKSKANNEFVRDAFLAGGIQFRTDAGWEAQTKTAARYDERARQDQELIEMLEKMVADTKR